MERSSAHRDPTAVFQHRQYAVMAPSLSISKRYCRGRGNIPTSAKTELAARAAAMQLRKKGLATASGRGYTPIHRGGADAGEP